MLTERNGFQLETCLVCIEDLAAKDHYLRKVASAVDFSFIYDEVRDWENGYCESFNAGMRDEFLNREVFGNMYEAEVLTRRWVEYYNTVRHHSSLGGKPPAPQVIIPCVVPATEIANRVSM